MGGGRVCCCAQYNLRLKALAHWSVAQKVIRMLPHSPHSVSRLALTLALLLGAASTGYDAVAQTAPVTPTPPGAPATLARPLPAELCYRRLGADMARRRGAPA